MKRPRNLGGIISGPDLSGRVDMSELSLLRGTGKTTMGLQQMIVVDESFNVPTAFTDAHAGAYQAVIDSVKAINCFFTDGESSYTSEPSVLHSSPMGENLHELLAQSNHPLTDTALEYIRELERKVSTLERKNYDLEKLNAKVAQENRELKKRGWKR